MKMPDRIVALCVLLAAAWPLSVGAQALHLETLGNGSVLIYVALPLADATSLAWPVVGPDGMPGLATLNSGSLTLGPDLDATFAVGDGPSTPAPTFVVAISGEPVGDISARLGALLAGRAAAPRLALPTPRVVEGSVERRLGRAGDEAVVRVEVPLPTADDPRRAAVEVLVELFGDLTGSELPGLLSRVVGDVASFELSCDAALAEMTLARLQVALEQAAASTKLEASAVERARRRLAVRRLARLEAHPEGATTVAVAYRDGGDEGVRQYLFGVGGVTVDGVRAAAQGWLPQHPGRAMVILPPQVFNPRFAPHPNVLHMDNDLSVAVVERPGAHLAALCLRPVVVPDLDGDLTATVLARLARAVRQQPDAPGWVEVDSRPPALTLAAPTDSFAELCEALQAALEVVAADSGAVGGAGGAAPPPAPPRLAPRRGVGAGPPRGPAPLLQPANLALGAVTDDGEVAAEALQKFAVGGAVVARPPQVEALTADQRSREAAPGSRSVLALFLELDPTSDAITVAVVGQVLAARLGASFAAREVEILRPLIPGRRGLVALIAADGELRKLEAEVRSQWRKVTTEVTESDLANSRRATAATLASEHSGALGQARLGAAVAAGADAWSSGRETEMRALGVGVEVVNAAFAGWAAFDAQLSTGAGLMATSEPAKQGR